MKLHQWLTVAFTAAFVTACGGGGDAGAPSSNVPVASTDTFQVKTAYINYFNDTSNHPFKISGTAAGYAVTGSGTVEQSSIGNGTFEGAPVLQKTSTVTGTFFANGTTYPLVATDTTYVDSNYVPKGWANGEYVVISNAATIPDTAKVNDTGLWHTSNRFIDSSKIIFLGTSQVSYALLPDTASTALLKITQVDKDLIGNAIMTATAIFRITPAGALTRLSETGVDITNNLTLTY